MVGEHVGIVAQVRRRQRRASTIQHRVYVKPVEQGSPIAVTQIIDHSCLGEEIGRPVCRVVPRRRAEHPSVGVEQVNATLRCLKVVNIAMSLGVAPLVVPWDQVGKLHIERDLRWLGQVEERDVVEDTRQPLRLGAPREIESPEAVLHRLTPHDRLGSQWHLAEVHKGTAQR